MKNSEFKEKFFRSDSLEQANRTNLKKRKGISLWMIALTILAGGLPIYLYLIVSGQMFEFEIIKKFFDSPEPIVSYKPIVNSKPDDSLPGNIRPKRKLKNSKRQLSQKKPQELIYSWVDEDGVKQFSNQTPSGVYNNLVVTKGITSKSSKKLYRKSSFSATRKVRETSVIIKNNQILIPVSLGFNGKEISTLLLLDTGATTTTIHNDFANQFGYFDYKLSKSRIADGSIVDTKITNFDYAIIGPYRMKNINISIMDYDGGSGLSKGLLGMNFLKNVNYQIDHHRKVIKWL